MSDYLPGLLAIVPRLRRFARVFTGDCETGDDLVELCLHRAMAELRDGPSNPDLEDTKHTVYRHLFKCCLDRGALGAQDAGQAGNGAERPNCEDPVTLNAALGSLPPPFKLTLLLVVLEGLSYEEVAAITGTSKNEVRDRVREARGWLINLMHSRDRPVDRPQRVNVDVEDLAVRN